MSSDPAHKDDDQEDTAGGNGVSRRKFVAGAAAAAAAIAGKPALAFAGGAGATPIYRIHPAIGVARLGSAARILKQEAA